MKKFDEYIIPINETAKDYDEMFVGIIRRQPVLTRCKDCKFHHDRTQCKKRIGAWFDDDYCNGAVRAERKEDWVK